MIPRWWWLWLAFVACVTASTLQAPLLIVGDVTHTKARILIDGALFSVVQVFLQPETLPTFTLDRTLPSETLITTDAPRVIVLEDLIPGRHYVITFHFDAHDEQSVKFHTVPLNPAPTRVLVISCDRFVDDGDDALWHTIERDLETHPDMYVGMAHIGDQVYVDAGALRVPLRSIDESSVPTQYQAIVTEFRIIYRKTFGRPAAQRVLRRGAHWMVPDDHEILNNLNSYFVDRIFGATPSDWTDANRRGRELHYRAGLQVLYEYQYQLVHDVAWDQVDFLHDPLDRVLMQYPLYFGVEINQLKLFFLDVRFDRSFTLRQANERRHLVSPRQREELTRQLTHWSSEKTSSIVVLASMPLFFHTPLTATIAYMVEKELYPGHPEHLAGLIDLYTLFQETTPALKLVVGGDVHTLAHTQVCGSSRLNRTNCFDQLITSGLTNGSAAINDAKLVPFYLLVLRLSPLFDWLLAAVGMASFPWIRSVDRVFLGRNYGVLEVDGHGNFKWLHSVILDHDSIGAQMTQWVFDALRLETLFIATSVMIVVYLLLPRCHRHTKVHKTE